MLSRLHPRIAGIALLAAVLVASPALGDDVAAGPAAGAGVRAVRVGNHPTYTRVVFELSRPAGYRIERRSGAGGKAEIVITLDAAATPRSVERQTVMVERVNVEEGFDRTVAHIVLKRKPSAVKEMILRNPARIVFDLVFPETMLAAQREAAARKTALAKKAEPTAKPVAKSAEKPAPKPGLALPVKPAPAPTAKPAARSEPRTLARPIAKPAEPAAKPTPAKPEPPKPTPDAVAKPGLPGPPAPTLARPAAKPPTAAVKPVPRAKKAPAKPVEPESQGWVEWALSFLPGASEPEPPARAAKPAPKLAPKPPPIAKKPAAAPAPKKVALTPTPAKPEPTAAATKAEPKTPAAAKAEPKAGPTPAPTKLALAPEPTQPKPAPGKLAPTPTTQKPEAKPDLQQAAAKAPTAGAPQKPEPKPPAAAKPEPAVPGKTLPVAKPPADPSVVARATPPGASREMPGPKKPSASKAEAPRATPRAPARPPAKKSAEPARAAAASNGGGNFTVWLLSGIGSVILVLLVAGLWLRRRSIPNDIDVDALVEEEQRTGGYADGGFSMGEESSSDSIPMSAGPGFGDDEPKENQTMETRELPVDFGSEQSTQVGMGGGADVTQLVRDLERRLAQVESQMAEHKEAREKLERQVTAQAEELRVQRAAIARTQRALRSLNRGGEEQATEPALREPSKPAPGA